ncbi:MAG: nuclear transport factor 2 family protein [Pseudomonadota bacterium]
MKNPTPSPLLAFKQYYEEFHQRSFDELDAIYADDVVFTDPIHVIRGREPLKIYFEGMCRNLTACHFDFMDEVIMGSRACYKWEMHYKHPTIKQNQPLKLTGATFITFSDKIESHEDFYDMGAMLYEKLPLMGSAIRMIKSRLEKNR